MVRERRSFSNDFKKQIVESIVRYIYLSRAGKRIQDITDTD